VGLGAGLALGAGDASLLALFDADMTLAGRDVSVAVYALFALTYAALGFAVGRLAMARERARANARTIAEQLHALEASQRALLQQEKLAAIGRLAAGVAHEVRNPLGVIRASATLVQESFAPGDEAHRACQFIREEIDRLNALITALLDFARPAELRMARVSLDEIVNRALQLCAPELARRGIELAREGGDGHALVADADLLSQVVFDLLQNASEALGRGGRIVIRARGGPRETEVEVADSGPGVPREVAEQVFEPFFTTKPGGTGLGLAMAARIVQAHGGSLEALEGRGAGEGSRGACFRLRLPQRSESAGRRAAA
jgi:two-component system sensor histidine kinase HydH